MVTLVSSDQIQRSDAGKLNSPHTTSPPSHFGNEVKHINRTAVTYSNSRALLPMHHPHQLLHIEIYSPPIHGNSSSRMDQLTRITPPAIMYAIALAVFLSVYFIARPLVRCYYDANELREYPNFTCFPASPTLPSSTSPTRNSAPETSSRHTRNIPFFESAQKRSCLVPTRSRISRGVGVQSGRREWQANQSF